MQSVAKQCELCGRSAALTFHHLIPRKMHRRTRFKKIYLKTELQSGIRICQLCHRGLHKLYNEMTLATRLNTKERLLHDEAVIKHIAWVKKQKRGLLDNVFSHQR